jgi:hypothetical protein
MVVAARVKLRMIGGHVETDDMGRDARSRVKN